MGVYIGGPYTYSAMQGPCDTGFHVPLNTEWQAVYDIWTALGGGSADGNNFGITLKLPYAGCRGSSSGDVGSQGTEGRYYSSSRKSDSSAYYLHINSHTIDPQLYYFCSAGDSIRCFKDTPVIPTSSWTKLYGTSIEAGGIFWSSVDGLISLSSDGQTWITISDKNLGATTVWNSGDTLSETNCGGYFQWGNNYMFPFTGNVTTSSTQVDASTYGPGNYYSSSTFIKYNGAWDSTDNGNLRGGETGAVQVIQDLKNAYIGEYQDWQPGANTIIYYPLNSTYTTQNLGTLGSSYNLANGGVTFNNYGGYFNGSSALVASTMLPDAAQYTVAFWCKPQTYSGRSIVLFDGSSTPGYDFGITCNLSEGIELWCKNGGMSYFKPTGWDNNWHCIIYTIDTTGINLYMDNQLVNSGTGSTANVGYHYYLHIGEFDDGATHNYWRYNGYLSDIVLDTSIWGASDRGKYYNSTKKN